MKEEECRWIAKKIALVLRSPKEKDLLESIRLQVHDLCAQFPIYPERI